MGPLLLVGPVIRLSVRSRCGESEVTAHGKPQNLSRYAHWDRRCGAPTAPETGLPRVQILLTERQFTVLRHDLFAPFDRDADAVAPPARAPPAPGGPDALTASARRDAPPLGRPGRASVRCPTFDGRMIGWN